MSTHFERAIEEMLKFNKAAQAKKREEWIRRYTGHFGEPSRLLEYRSGQLVFNELYRSAMKMAQNIVAEAGAIEESAFDPEP